MNQHVRNVHEKKLFKCGHCGAGFKRKGLLRVHNTKVHGGDSRLTFEEEQGEKEVFTKPVEIQPNKPWLSLRKNVKTSPIKGYK